MPIKADVRAVGETVPHLATAPAFSSLHPQSALLVRGALRAASALTLLPLTVTSMLQFWGTVGGTGLVEVACMPGLSVTG